ncbi:MAG: hypothetical protein K2F87_04865 [Muribaculaceae bacterium]|nr:hypothetical protein [Muribaculaceae bacterium]
MKKPRLHIFVPENDLALAAGTSNYTPPPIGLKMHLAGEILPLSYASEGDRFLSYGFSDAELRRLTTMLGKDVDLASREEIVSGRFTPTPWGWSQYTRSLFTEMGVPECSLPTRECIEELRMLSHRRTSVAINKDLGYEGGMEIFTPEAAVSLLSDNGDFYLKQPWSGSGRGVMATAGMSRDAIIKFATASIRRQGSVIAEKALPSVGDFATLWYCENGSVTFHGYSRFLTHGDGGKYAGNLVASQEFILKNIIALGLESDQIFKIVDELRTALTARIASHYCGPIGVDMLAYKDGAGDTYIAPCIEVNLRYTMGFVAEGLARKLSLPSPRLLCVVPWEETCFLPAGSIILSQPGTFAYVLKPYQDRP